jgi:aminopeptidase N
MWGYRESLRYINGKKSNVRNEEPIIGIYNVQHEGSGDMYDKGQLVLNTLRSVINNDSVWVATLRGLYTTFRYKSIGAEDVFTFFNRATGKDLGPIFEQYLKRAAIPRLEVALRIKGDSTAIHYRWNTDVKDFRMPVRVTTLPGKFEFITPTTGWQQLVVGKIEPEEFRVDEDRFYVDLRLSWSYLDKRLEESRGSGRSSWF